MDITSLWEFNCYFLPELALKEYKEGLSCGELGEFLADESLRKIAKSNRVG